MSNGGRRLAVAGPVQRGVSRQDEALQLGKGPPEYAVAREKGFPQEGLGMA